MFGIFFIYLLLIIYSTLVFILSVLLSISPSILVRSGSSHILYRRRRSSFITVHNSDLGVLYILLFPSGLGGTFDYFSRQYHSGKGFFFILLLGDFSLILVHDTIGWAKSRRLVSGVS